MDKETDDQDYVTLMSVHAAKGLEFKSVFIVGLEEKLFPSFMSMDTVEALDEERRLFYVAITRAEQLLTLSYATSRYRYGQMRYNEPSRFLEEVPSQHIEATAFVRSLDREEPSSTGGSPQKSGIQGNFQKSSPGLKIDPADFKPSPAGDIQPGMKVLHLKFGAGKVLAIDGGANNRIATIFFSEMDNPQRRIMLKFARLQILD
jgi:DNA helicase-2/ATP-dependent DNA helicase PcrA